MSAKGDEGANFDVFRNDGLKYILYTYFTYLQTVESYEKTNSHSRLEEKMRDFEMREGEEIGQQKRKMKTIIIEFSLGRLESILAGVRLRRIGCLLLFLIL